MNTFVYDIPTKVYFGENQLGHLGEELAVYGSNVLICYGGGFIKRSGIDDTYFSVMANKACGGAVLSGFKLLNQSDIEKIFAMCV